MTDIEWARNSDGSRGKTWNPIVGCSIKSPGCIHCYAMRLAWRLAAMGQARYQDTVKKVKGEVVWTGKLVQAPETTLLEPIHRRKPTTYFVNSMSDLFHEALLVEWIDLVFAIMALCPQHTFQVLTKRSSRMRAYCSDPATPHRIARACLDLSLAAKAKWTTDPWPVRSIGEDVDMPDDVTMERWPLPNVWLGVSTERQIEADERIPDLLQTPAAIRFISAEPLLGPINLDRIHEWYETPEGARVDMWESCISGKRFDMWAGDDDDPMQPGFPKLDWVIVGGESGKKARPMHPAWARSLRDQCASAGVAFFFKQWGVWVTEDQSPEDIVLPSSSKGPWAKRDEHGSWSAGDQTQVFKVKKAAAGRLLDGVDHSEMPRRVG